MWESDADELVEHLGDVEQKDGNGERIGTQT